MDDNCSPFKYTVHGLDSQKSSYIERNSISYGVWLDRKYYTRR